MASKKQKKDNNLGSTTLLYQDVSIVSAGKEHPNDCGICCGVLALEPVLIYQCLLASHSEPAI